MSRRFASLALNLPQVESRREARTVSFEDLYAGKIVAALDRQHPRDLFDVRDLIANEGISDMVKRKFLPLFDRVAEKYREEWLNSEPPERFNWHALRHFAVSCWIDAGLKPKTVQTFAGHSSLQVTMDRYGHLFKSDDHKEAMDAIAADMFG